MRTSLLCACTAIALRCAPAEPLPTAFFSAPAGMALAGRAFDQLFVANTGRDALQVVRMASRISQIDTVPSDARYFPLNIPVGPSPSVLAASADGRFVFALDSINGRVTLVDADGLARARGPDGAVITLDVGDAGSEPTAMLGAQQSCTPSEPSPTSACLGRVYVAVRNLGSVQVIDVRQDLTTQALSLQVDRTYAINAAVMRMATDPNEEALFITNAQSPQLLRLSLTQGTPESPVLRSVDIGAIAGPVTVSADGDFVVVGRPALQDVLVLTSDAGGVAQGDALHVVPANAILTPAPKCLQLCEQPEAACGGAHEADAALCLENGALALRPDASYAGLYLGGVPAQLAGLGVDAQGRKITASCESIAEGRKTTEYTQAVAVAQLDGTLRLIGLRNASGAVQIELLDAGFCRTPTLERYVNQTLPLDTVLAPCVQASGDAKRFGCVAEPNAQTGLVTVLRGQADGQAWGLVWEGLAADMPASINGVVIDADGNLTVAEQLLTNRDIVVQKPPRFGAQASGGDVVEVLTTPAAHDVACSQALSQGARSCQFERRITAMAPSAEPHHTTLVLDRPLPKACFASGLSIRILAGDAFVVVPVDQTGAAQASVARLSPGDTFGPGTVANQTPSLSFAVRADLDAATQADACTRYDRSQPGPHPSEGLARGQLISWLVQDPFRPQPLAERLDALSRPQGPMGRMPQDIVATRNVSRQATRTQTHDFLCISYGGSDGVLVLDPYDAPSPENRDTTSRLLQ